MNASTERGGSPPLADLIVHRESVQGSQTCGEVYEAFQGHGHEYVAVLDGERVLGVISRSRLGFLFGSQFGYSLFHRKPVESQVIREFTAVRDEHDLVGVLASVLSRSGPEFHHDVVVLSREGGFEGIVTIQALARMQTGLLARNLEELEARNRGLVAKTDELLAATVMLNARNSELLAAREAAMEASRLKSLFLAKVSHELRTPMNGILGFTDLLFGTALTEEQQEYARTVRDSAGQLLAVLTDILEFAVLEAGKAALDLQPVALGRTMLEVVERLRPQAEAKGLAVGCEISPVLERAVLADRVRWEQVTTHLFANAIKFTAAGAVGLRAYAVAEEAASLRLRLEVCDSGPGISSDVAPRLFEAFRQGDDGLNRRHDGLGLGLSLVRHNVELMGGTVGSEARFPAGTTFWVEVPLGLAPVVEIGPPTITGEGPAELGGLRAA